MRKERDQRIDNDNEFLLAPRYQNRLDKYLASNPEGTSFANIAKLLSMKVQDVERIYAKALLLLRDLLD
jgi:hypothetical protein